MPGTKPHDPTRSPVEEFERQATATPCACCIENSGGFLGNVERAMITAVTGEPMGLRLRDAAAAESWMRSLGTDRCPCLPPRFWKTVVVEGSEEDEPAATA